MSDEKRDDGGPAFTRGAADSNANDPTWLILLSGGMSMRDYFAGQALMGFAAGMDSGTRKKYRDGHADGLEAKTAYQLADAMLEARK